MEEERLCRCFVFIFGGTVVHTVFGIGVMLVVPFYVFFSRTVLCGSLFFSFILLLAGPENRSCLPGRVM